jgi:phosphohistidine swiveling domain-containing protein
MSTKYFKELARNYSLFQVVAYTEFMSRSAPELKAVLDPGQPLFVYTGEGLVKIYYPEGGLKEIYGSIGRIMADADYFHGVVAKFLEVVEEIKPYFLRKKSVENVREARRLYELFLDYYYGEAVVWVVPLADNLSEALRLKALSVRVETQELTSWRDELFDYSLGRLFPELGELTHFVLPQSVFGGKTAGELLKEAKRSQKGYIYFRGRIYTGRQDRILKKLNIELETDQPAGKVDSVHGQVASPGRIRGSARIVLTNKDLSKVSDGDVLVSPMTRPDFLPAMKISAAFVTDEGGITCHAAIVARELKKPCVIGTKIATQVLHDGDLVEVDADSGVVRIIKE